MNSSSILPRGAGALSVLALHNERPVELPACATGPGSAATDPTAQKAPTFRCPLEKLLAAHPPTVARPRPRAPAREPASPRPSAPSWRDAVATRVASECAGLVRLRPALRGPAAPVVRCPAAAACCRRTVPPLAHVVRGCAVRYRSGRGRGLGLGLTTVSAGQRGGTCGRAARCHGRVRGCGLPRAAPHAHAPVAMDGGRGDARCNAARGARGGRGSHSPCALCYADTSQPWRARSYRGARGDPLAPLTPRLAAGAGRSGSCPGTRRPRRPRRQRRRRAARSTRGR
jgi:hypothetical protein